MIDGLRAYAEKKPSGLPWLGDVPAHWELGALGRFLTRIEQGWSPVAAEGELEADQWAVLSLSSVRRGIFVPTAVKPVSRRANVPQHLELKNGDLLLTRSNTRERVGDVCVVRKVRPRTFMSDLIYRLVMKEGAILSEFAMYQMLSNYGRWQVERDARGSSDSMPKIAQRHIKGWNLLCPPLDEQRLIVRFLDWQGAQTAKLIRAKKKIIALLNEQKQAIIYRAVTRGLDPNVRLKPSGNPWLGDVPEGWGIARLRYITRCLDGKRVPLNGTQRESMRGSYPYWGANRVFDHINDWLFDEPLVLLGEDGAPFFDVGKDVAFAVEGKIWVNNHAHVLRCGPRMTTQFLAYALNCVDFRNFISGSTRDKLTQQAMGSIPVQIPPLSEQDAIVTHLSVSTAELAATNNQIQQEIALIQEFRSRLIADVVTGKLDVRAAAASLPEAFEPEAIDDLAEDEDLEDPAESVENEEVAA